MAYQKQTWRDYDESLSEAVNIANGAVLTAGRMNNIEAGIADNEVGDGSVDTTKLANGAVTNPKLGNNSVGTNNLINGSVTESKLGKYSVTFRNLDGEWGIAHSFNVGPLVTINFQTRQTTNNPFYLFVGTNRYLVPKRTISIPTITTGYQHYLFYDVSASTLVYLDSISIKNYAGDIILLAILNTDKYLITKSDRRIFALYDSSGILVDTNKDFYGFNDGDIDGLDARVTTLESKSTAVIDKPHLLTVNMQTGLLEHSKNIYVLQPEGSKRILANSYDLGMSVNPTYTRKVYFLESSVTLEVIEILEPAPANSKFLFFIDPVQQTCFPNVEGIRWIDSAGNVVNEPEDPAPVPLPTEHEFRELVLPDKVYLMEGEQLPIYKSSIVYDAKMEDLNNVQTSLIDPVKPYYEDFQERLILDSSKVSSPFRIGTVQKGTFKKSYKSMTLVTGTASNLQGKSPNILLIGDSLTHDGMARVLNQKLTEKGATANIVGTFADHLTVGFSSEARGYWNYRAFTGQDTIISGIPITLPSTTATTTTKFQNPFMRLATSADYTAHPDWCFRRTTGGKLKELSYATDTDKTGDFYIFDFAWYLTQRQVPTPDIITIALSTNDIQLDTGVIGADWYSMAQKGLKILIEQIKAAVPNITIGLIPAPEWGENTKADGFQDEVKQWIEYCKTAVKNYTNVDLVPVWMNMNENWDWDMSKNVVNLPSGEVQGETNDSVHFVEAGRKEYATTVMHWLSTKTL